MLRVSFKHNDGKKLRFFAAKGKDFVKGVSKDVTFELAKDFLKKLKSDLKNDGLDLIPLSHRTVAKKRAQGLEMPKSPLYGRGSRDPKSMYSLLEIKKSEKSCSVGYRPNVKHHSGIRIQQLAILHAQGFFTGRAYVPARNPISESFNREDFRKNTGRAYLKSATRRLKEWLGSL